jgi:G3E family GTPase
MSSFHLKKSILESIYSINYFGRSGTDFLKISNMITVLDGGNLELYLSSDENTGKVRRKHLLHSDPRKPLEELLIEQVECADLLILNKEDCLDISSRERFLSYLESLNPHAQEWTCQFGKIPTSEVLNRSHFNEKITLSASGWERSLHQNRPDAKKDEKLEHNHEHNHEHSHHHNHSHRDLKHDNNDHDHQRDEHNHHTTPSRELHST